MSKKARPCQMYEKKRFWPGILLNHLKGAGRKSSLSRKLETHIFEDTNIDWLHCIAVHRKK